ncbi:MAG: hemerythrin [Chloroflexi bacterium RBG_16_50_9]|nr:MAG: hemerythrin [Chloroflexi bacterium RBG_16_50_9]
MSVKLNPIVEFREDHRKVRDFLLDLAFAAEKGEVGTAQEILGELDAVLGPHFRYEEETLYPALKEFLGDYVDGLISEHDSAISAAKTAVGLLSQPSLSKAEGKKLAKTARALLVHVSNCDGLNILAERFSQEKLDTLAERYSRSRAEGVPLLRWADTIRRRKN